MLTSHAVTKQKYKRHLKRIMIVGDGVSNNKKRFRGLNKGNDLSAQVWNPALYPRKYSGGICHASLIISATFLGCSKNEKWPHSFIV